MEVGRTQQAGRSGQAMPGEKRQSSTNQNSGSSSYQGSSSYKQDNYSSTYQNKPSNSGRQSQSDPVYQNKPSNSSSYQSKPSNSYQNDPVYQNKPSNSSNYQNKPNNSYQNDPVYQNRPSNSTYQNKPNNSYHNDPVYQNRPSNQTYQNKPRYNDYDYDYDRNRYNRPTIVIGTVREDMINASVNAMYSSVGTSGIRATDAAARKLDNNYDGYVSKSEMKEALRYDRVALSLKNHDNSYGRYWDAQEVSSDVARRMDQADGYRDGFVDMSVFGDFFSGWDSWLGVARGGITTSELSSRLATGDLVIGGSIRTRSNARNSGFTIAELHQNANGPKMTIAAY